MIAQNYDENKVVLSGRLVQDALLKYTLNKTPILRFTLAVNTYYKDKKETLYIPVVSFGELALEISSLVKKGVNVKVEGRLVNRKIEFSEEEQYKFIEVVANKIEVFTK
jgi:single-strand DNA-binding protein